MKIKINKDNKEVFLNDKNKTLVSFSSIKHLFNKDIEFVPDKFIENSTIFGKNIMVGLKSLFAGDNTFLSKISEEEKKCIKTILNKIIADKLEVEQVEFHADNQIFHGFIDIKLKGNKFIELKCKSHDKLEKDVILQVAVYKHILGPNFQELIWYYNKKTGQIKEYKLDIEQVKECAKIIAEIEDIWSFFNGGK